MTQSTQALQPLLSLPPEIVVLQRDWLSANNFVFLGQERCTVVDTGYCSHGPQTVALVQACLGGRSLDAIVNTHLHSDHCGGNAALQAAWPLVQTAIPPGQAQAVRDWDPVALSYAPTGQECPPFRFDSTLAPGSTVDLGDKPWQVHAAPGHDPHAVVLFEPQARLLISGDALWENGFGVVFPELDGEDAFDAVDATLTLIEGLAPRIVLPGHGAVFGDVPAAIARARNRLERFTREPLQHARYAAKVLLKYKLLEWQSIAYTDLCAWVQATALFGAMHARHFSQYTQGQWLDMLINELQQSGALRREGDRVINR